MDQISCTDVVAVCGPITCDIEYKKQRVTARGKADPNAYELKFVKTVYRHKCDEAMLQKIMTLEKETLDADYPNHMYHSFKVVAENSFSKTFELRYLKIK